MPLAPHRTVLASIGLGFLLMAANAGAQPKPPDGLEHAGTSAQVLTRAVVRSFHEEPGGKSYVRLKLLPRAKLPFTVQTFRVADRSLLAGLSEGASVKFTSRHIDGENTVTSIHAVAGCQRFQPCD
jgi:Cu/Ag efflux protein CusF